MEILDIKKDIDLIPFQNTQYLEEENVKSQIFLHHTAGNSNGYGVFKDWESNPERIATCVVICGKPGKNDTFKNGQIVQGFSSKYWAYHLGLTESTFHKFNLPYKSLDKISIGIEICNWGQLTYKSGKYYNYVNKAVDESEVTVLTTPFRGNKYYHSYTDEQINSVEKLLRYFGEKYKISLTYNPDIFDVTPRCLKGESGVYAHVSCRYDKNDIYPNPKLINMLKTL